MGAVRETCNREKGRPTLVLKVAVISGLFHPSYGGPFTVVANHVSALSKRAVVKLFGVVPPGSTEKLQSEYPDASLFPLSFPRRWFRAVGLKETLENEIRNVDVVHLHMLWDYPVFVGAQVCRAARKPFVITPHGSLSDPWRYSSLHKRAYLRLIGRRILSDAAAIHAVGEKEARALKQFPFARRVALIPNGVPPLCSRHQLRGNPALPRALTEQPDQRVMLYLGRLCRDKGLDALVLAWAKIVNMGAASGWRLIIAGPDYRGYRRVLEADVQRLRIGRSIIITDPVYGEHKEALLERANCFVLPSRAEGFSMALLEAMSAAKPAVYSHECDFPALAKTGGGWEVQVNASSLAEALIEVCSAGTPALERAGQAAFDLWQRKYSLDVVGDELMALYYSVQPRSALGSD
jgi:glycosyltransferase involved in cell wall biosynthesis